MKNFSTTKLVMAILLFVFGTFVCQAQDNFFEKYEDMDGVTVVSISPEMLQIMCSMKTDEDGLDLAEMEITGMQILSTERKDIRDQMKTDFSKMIDMTDYKEIMRIKDDESNVVFYILQEGDIINKMIMLAEEQDECTIIILSGNFTMQVTMQVAKSMTGTN